MDDPFPTIRSATGHRSHGSTLKYYGLAVIASRSDWMVSMRDDYTTPRYVHRGFDVHGIRVPSSFRDEMKIPSYHIHLGRQLDQKS